MAELEIPQGPIDAAPVAFVPAAEQERLLLETLATAGVELGAYDRRIVAWLAGWDWPTVAPMLSWLRRAAVAGRYRTCEMCSAGTLAGRPCGICEYQDRVAAEAGAVDDADDSAGALVTQWQVMRHDERVTCLPSWEAAQTYCEDEVEQRHGELVDQLVWHLAVDPVDDRREDYPLALYMVAGGQESDTGWAIWPVHVVVGDAEGGA